MEKQRYEQVLAEIRYCKDLTDLESIVQTLLRPTGFGSNGLAESGVDAQLDYYEMAECLKETDRAYFQHEIELLIFANQQIPIIQNGQVAEKPQPVQPWEFFSWA